MTAPQERVVRRIPAGWGIFVPGGSPPLAVARTKREAEALARRQLGALGGGWLTVFKMDGRPPERRFSGGPPPEPATTARLSPETPPNSLQKLHDEGESADKWVTRLLDVLAFLGIPAATVFQTLNIAPDIGDAIEDGWIYVFLATLSLSLATAIVAFLGFSGHSKGAALYGAAFGAVAVAGSIAGSIGRGTLDLTVATSTNPIVSTLIAAVVTWGIGGAAAAILVGLWVGFRVGQRFPAG